MILLTYSTRPVQLSLSNLLMLWPTMISRVITPKLYTSDLVEYSPPAYSSGAMYPLQWETVKPINPCGIFFFWKKKRNSYTGIYSGHQPLKLCPSQPWTKFRAVLFNVVLNPKLTLLSYGHDKSRFHYTHYTMSSFWEQRQ